MTDREQSLSRLRSSLYEQVKEQQELQQAQMATISSHWNDMTRERKDIAEARISARNFVNKSIQDYNDLTTKGQPNIDELNELKHDLEQIRLTFAAVDPTLKMTPESSEMFKRCFRIRKR